MKATNHLDDRRRLRVSGSDGGFINFLFVSIIATTLTLISTLPASGEMVPTNGLVWAGLDYSQVRLIGEGKFDYSFDNAWEISSSMFQQWNQLFIDECIADAGEDMEKIVSQDLGGVTARNTAAGTNQIILHPGAGDGIKDTHLTADAIAAEVQALNLKHTNGLGLVFIVDRFVYGIQKANTIKVQNSTRVCAGAVYVVFFDVATRRVFSAKRVVGHIATGMTFRNFWFGPIKDAAATLDHYRDLKISS